MNNKELQKRFEEYIKNNVIKNEKLVKYNLTRVLKKDPKFDRISRIKRNNSCYFCGFDKVINKKHIN